MTFLSLSCFDYRERIIHLHGFSFQIHYVMECYYKSLYWGQGLGIQWWRQGEGKKLGSSGKVPHFWVICKLDSVHELLNRDNQFRLIAIQIFSMDGCNDLLVFHKKINQLYVELNICCAYL